MFHEETPCSEEFYDFLLINDHEGYSSLEKGHFFMVFLFTENKKR